MIHNKKLLVALYLQKLSDHKEHLHFTFIRSTNLYASIQMCYR